MRVVINGLAALKPKTGVGHHVANLAAALAGEYLESEFDLYPGRRIGSLVQRLNRPPSEPSSTSSTFKRNLLGRMLGSVKSTAKAASRFHFSAYTRLNRFDLYHEPNFIPFAVGLPTVVTVHDLSVVRFPEWHPADRVRMHEDRFATGLRQADHVIVVSDAVRREVITLLGFPADQVTVIPNGISPAFRPRPVSDVEPVRRRLGLPARFFLCVGTIEPRKNVGTAMRAFADLPAAVRETCPLVLVGPWGWKSEADRDYYERVGRDRGIRQLGYVADADLPALYAGATGLVYPTHYEGFGLPPLEMLASGGAALVSTADAVREVCGPHGLAIPAVDLAGWRDAMHRLATDDDFRANLTRGGVEHAARFTWPNAARATHAVYQTVLAARERSLRPTAQHHDVRHRVEQPVQHDAGTDAVRPRGQVAQGQGEHE